MGHKRLLRIPKPFDYPDWICAPKMDGFRAVADVQGQHRTLISDNGQILESLPQLPRRSPRGKTFVRSRY